MCIGKDKPRIPKDQRPEFCPRCGGETLDWDDEQMDFDEKTATVEVRCDICEYEWREVWGIMFGHWEEIE